MPEKGKIRKTSTYYAGGGIKSTGYFVGDTIKNGVFKTFFEEGQLQSVVNFEMGKKNGIEECYYPNGRIKSYARYSHGVIDSVAILYYPNGNVEVKSQLSDGHFLKASTHYDTTGILRRFTYFFPSDSISYDAAYDKEGKLLRGEGRYLLLQPPDKNIFHVGDTLTDRCLYIIPPRSRV